MDFPGYFAEHILPEKIHVLNVSFQVNGIREKFGGTAGNIAYALALMGEQPVIAATVGHDHQNYLGWLKRNGISTQAIKPIDSEQTACAYITTDRADNQITGFHAGAMKHQCPLDFDRLDPKDTIVTVSPGNLDDMREYPASCRARGINYIFDPGQSLPMWQGKDLAEAINGAGILICNDYEFELIMDKTGLGKAALLELAPTLIVTKGGEGSIISMAEGEIGIPAFPPEKVVDPTGAGDAYRGGLLSGLAHGKSIQESAIMGSVCASFCVECYGTQEYRFTKEEFEERLKQCSSWVATN